MKRERKKSKKPFIFFVVIILIIAAVFVIKNKDSFFKAELDQPGTVTTDTKSILEKVLKTSDFSTLEFNYDAIKTVSDNDGNPEYHVAYSGIVKSGIDFSKINIELDEENKLVTITIPDPEIQSVEVDAGKLDYIFEDEKYNNEKIIAQAYKECLADLEEKAKNNPMVMQMARENAKDAVTALTEPWLKQGDSEYKVEVK